MNIQNNSSYFILLLLGIMIAMIIASETSHPKYKVFFIFNVPCLHHGGFCLKGVEPELVKTHMVGYLDVKESPADDG